MTQQTVSSTSSPPSASSQLPRGVPPFLHHLLTISTVQICREAGYTRAQSSALDTLTSLLHQYVRELGLTAKAYAELANRQHVNLLDLLSALDDYQHGVRLLMDYRANSDSLPFYHPAPHFPVPRPLLKVQPGGLADAAAGYTAQFAALNPHVPPFLPAFPEERTYAATPSVAKADPAAPELRKRKMEQNRAVEGSLERLSALERQRQKEERATEDDSKRARRDTAAEDVDAPSAIAPSDPATHVPAVAPQSTSGGARERERERVLSKNPFLALPLPPIDSSSSSSSSSTATEEPIPPPRAVTPAPPAASARSDLDDGAALSSASPRGAADDEKRSGPYDNDVIIDI